MNSLLAFDVARSEWTQFGKGSCCVKMQGLLEQGCKPRCRLHSSFRLNALSLPHGFFCLFVFFFVFACLMDCE